MTCSRFEAIVAQQPSPWWSHLNDAQLETVPVSKLKLSIRNHPLQKYRNKLLQELQRCGIEALKPNLFFGDEWYCPEDSICIGLPFQLAHPRLFQLSKKRGKPVEGGSVRWFMCLLRHEVGHAFDHAYEISTRRDFRDIFGDPEQKYLEAALNQTYTRNADYLSNLPGGYGQSHPLEDFAETVAWFLAHSHDTAVVGHLSVKAGKKVAFVQKMIGLFGASRPRKSRRDPLQPSYAMRRKLGSYLT